MTSDVLSNLRFVRKRTENVFVVVMFECVCELLGGQHRLGDAGGFRAHFHTDGSDCAIRGPPDPALTPASGKWDTELSWGEIWVPSEVKFVKNDQDV